jgi:hypothetical protein
MAGRTVSHYRILDRLGGGGGQRHVLRAAMYTRTLGRIALALITTTALWGAVLPQRLRPRAIASLIARRFISTSDGDTR